MAFCGYLKQSTAATIQLGPFVDEDDGKTAETGLTIEDTDVFLSKNGAAQANPNNTDNCAHDARGYYTKALSTTDTGTLGLLTVVVHKSGALPVRQDYQVVVAHWWDTMCSTDYLHVDVKQIEAGDPSDTIRDSVVDDATRIDASSINAVEGKVDTVDSNVDSILADTGTDGVVLANDAITAAKIAANAIGASELAASAVNEIADQVWNEAQADHVAVGSFGEVATEIASILADTGTDGVLLANDAIDEDALAASALAEINAQVVDALATDTYAEPGQGAPPATASLKDKIGYLYKAWRNKVTQTSTTLSVYDDAGAVVDQKATVSDDGSTFTRGEIGTGA